MYAPDMILLKKATAEVSSSGFQLSDKTNGGSM